MRSVTPLSARVTGGCSLARAPLPQLIGRANFSYFRFGQDPVIREETIRPAEPYERGPKDLFMVHPGEVVYLQGFFDFPGRCQRHGHSAAAGSSARSTSVLTRASICFLALTNPGRL